MSEKGDLYKLTRTDDVTTGVPERYLTISKDGGASSDDLAKKQCQWAIERSFEDTSNYPCFPWPSLDRIALPMAPGNLVIVTARTGQGKSLFLQNLFHDLIIAGRFGLYIGLEQPAHELRIKWACLANDIHPRLILAPTGAEQRSSEWRNAVDLVQEHFKWQGSADVRSRAHFASARKINRQGLSAWTEWGVDHGCEFIIVDHIDRVDHGDGSNSFHEISESIRLAKELANRQKVVMILASQVGRPGDALEQFMPPALHNMRGAGTKEEEADTVLGIFRPLKPEVTAVQLQDVRKGFVEAGSVIEQNVMGVQVLKHRLYGAMTGELVKLGVKHQRVFELPERDRHSTIYGGKNL